MTINHASRFFALLAALVCALACTLARAEELNLSFDYGNLPAEKQFLGDIVRTRIAERSDGGTLSVAYSIDTSLAPEEYVLQADGGSATITGGDVRALVFGTGALLRAIDYAPERFTVPAISLREKPDTSFRCCYFARHYHNWYNMASAEEQRRYVEDLALWGFNTITAVIIPTFEFTSQPDQEQWDRMVDSFLACADCAKRMEMNIASITCPNQGWRDLPERLGAVTGERVPDDDLNVCYSKEGAREYLDNLLRKFLGTIDSDTLDYFVFWPFDEGGCLCENCSPWANNGFLRITDEQSRLIEDEGLSRCDFILSTWWFAEHEFEAVWKWLEDHPRFKYVLADGGGGAFPQYPKEHPLPEGHSLITFPEISMWGRDPWGGYGATVLANHLSGLWSNARGYVDGCMLYSEGIYEDINKVIEGGFYCGDLPADESLRRYARYELCGVDPEDFLTLAHDFEKIHHISETPSDSDRQTAVESMRRVIKMDSMINPKLRDCWRWRQIYCRAVTDYERCVHKTINTPAYAEAIRELREIYRSDLPEGCATPSFPKGEIQNFPRPEEELK